VLIGEVTPEFELPDLEGVVHRLADHSGQIVVLNFWSASCPHVERTDEFIATWSEREWGAAVSVLSIASNASETVAELTQAATRRHIPRLLLDRGHLVADRFQAQTTPHVFVIDREGNLRYRGAVDDASFARRVPSRFFLNEVVNALLAGRTPPVAETAPYGCAIIREALE